MGSGLVTSTLVVARRALLKFVRTPQLVVFGSVQMVLFPVSYTHLRAHETLSDLVCRLLLEKNFFF